MKRVLGVGLLLLASSAAGWSYTIDLLATNRLWNTGFTAGGVYGTNDAQDGHYQWVEWAGPGYGGSTVASGTAYIINDTGFPMNAWRPNIANTAAWVSINQGPPYLDASARWFTFYTIFNLPTDSPLWNVNITFDVWADNTPQAVGLYRGNSLATAALVDLVTPAIPSPDPTLGYSVLYDSSPSTTGLTLSGVNLTPGDYLIRFDVYNAPGARLNPTGLFALYHSATADAVPEPTSMALMATGGLALLWLRRRSAQRAK